MKYDYEDIKVFKAQKALIVGDDKLTRRYVGKNHIDSLGNIIDDTYPNKAVYIDSCFRNRMISYLKGRIYRNDKSGKYYYRYHKSMLAHPQKVVVRFADNSLSHLPLPILDMIDIIESQRLPFCEKRSKTSLSGFDIFLADPLKKKKTVKYKAKNGGEYYFTISNA